MTFEHLDDPSPPRPSELVMERIAAEGGRRLRHRRLASGTAAALLVVVGSVGIVSQVHGGRDRVVIGPNAPTTTAPEPQSSTVVTQPDNEEDSPTFGPGEEEGAFAAIIQVQDEDIAQVVLASAETGGVTRVLAEFPLFSRPWSCCVAWSPDRETVYFVKPAGDYGAGQEVDTIWQVPARGDGEPQRVDEGFSPAVSPDSRSLAYIRPLASTVDELVLRDLSSGDLRIVETPPGQTLGSVAFSGAGSVILTLAAAGQPETAYLLGLDDAELSMDDARRLGPAEDAPDGTGWSASDAYVDEGTATFVERCCSAGDVAEDATFIVIDTATGDRIDSVELPGLAVDAPSSPSGGLQLFLLAPPDAPGPTTLLLRVSMDAPTPVPLEATTIIAVDW